MLKYEAQNILETVLDNDDWYYNKVFNDKTDRLLYHYAVKNDGLIDSIDCQFAIMEDEVVSMAFYPVKIDKERFTDISEFINGVNTMFTSFVNFHLDYEHNMVMVSWHHDISCELSFDEELAERMVWEPVLSLFDYSEDLFLIANAGVSGKEQLEIVSKRMDEMAVRDESGDDDDEANENKPKSIKFVIRL